MRRSVWSGFALVVAVAGALAAGGCSTKQVRQEGDVTGMGAAGGSEAAGGAGRARATELPVSGGDSGAGLGTGGMGGTAGGGGGVTGSTPLEPPPAETAAVERAPERALPGGGLAGETTPGLKRIFFDFDQSAVTSTSRETLTRNAQYLREKPGARIRVEGHCDERGTTEYNLGLGDRRAKAAFQYLMDLGIDPNRMSPVSYGEEVPLDPGHNEEAWARNRRAEFVEILQ